MRRLTACLVPVVNLPLAAATDVFARAKTDVVVVLNGDHVTCEIKELQRGMLTVKTDDMGTLDIKWEKVIGLESGYYFRVEVSSGARFFGTPHLEQGDSVMRVTGVDAVAALDLVNVVSITPIEQSFLDRFDGSLSLGFSYTRASSVAQLTFDWANIFRTERNLVDTKANAIVTDKGTDEETSRKGKFSTTWNRLLRKKWTGSVSGAG
ncbi:MAG: hypothetical protein OEO21_00410 [Candidatus Krumholzibacteria bacterium]|nr:hypothetical protein [Candidatus Krumholzibacteria bacterium]